MGTTEKVPPVVAQDVPGPFPDHYFGAMEEWEEFGDLMFEICNGHDRYFGDNDATIR